MTTRRGDCLCVVAACAIWLLAAPAWGQLPEQRLKSFGLAGEAGSKPVGLLAGSDGVLYGTTSEGGIYSAGTAFKVNPDGSGFTVLHAFSTNGVDGQAPLAGLILARDGMLYGTTSAGGSNLVGTVFRVARDGSSFAVLHHFGSFFADGTVPQAQLVQGTDGGLYGTTYSGGTNGAGAVFKLNVNGGGYAVLHSFGDGLTDGSSPKAGLIQGQDGVLYGTTYGEPALAGGTVFKLATNGTGYSQLHAFGTGTDGAQPYGLVQGTNGLLYGVTEWGGTNADQYGNPHGTIYRLNTNGTGYAMLHGFNGELGDGAEPHAALVQGTDGGWYGTTYAGGSLQDDGTVFRFNADGSGYEVIRRFTVITSIISDYSIDGQGPGQLVQATDGSLYGATLYGGTTGQGAYQGSGSGTLFRLAPNGSGYAVIHNFSVSGADAATPLAGLLFASDGAFYGTTETGGLGGQGAIFKLGAHGSGYGVVYDFGLSQIDGQMPQAALIQGRDGLLYGTTSQGGYGNGGMAFKVRLDGSFFTLLHSFGSIANDGDSPVSPLVQGRDGALYGTTPGGGYTSDYGGFGTVFTVNSNGTVYSVLHYFSTNSVEGQSPYGGLIQGADGALYGTTHGGPYYGGFGQNYGTVFKMLTNGAGFQVLHTFTNNGVEGTYPSAGLIQGMDGALYGTAQAGGSNHLQGGNFGGSGIVFKVRTDGLGYQILHQFGGTPTDGQNPAASLIQGSDGALYGTTTTGGAFNDQFGRGYGTVFELNTNGSGYSVLYSFGGHYGNTQYPQDGIVPQGALAMGADGALYGTTSAGGDMNFGTVFRLGAPPFAFTSFSRLADKTFSMTISGSSNTTCRVDVSTNLVNWTTLTNLANTNGVVQFKDTAAPNFPRRFYRAFQGP